MIYQQELAEFIRCSRRYIPRKLKNFEHLRVYHRYWLPDYGPFKVRDTSYDSGIEFFYITYDNDTKQAVLSYPIYNIGAYTCFMINIIFIYLINSANVEYNFIVIIIIELDHLLGLK